MSLNFFCFLAISITLAGCTPTTGARQPTGKAHSRQELKAVLENTGGHNVVDDKTVLIKDRLTAIHMAEPLLFSIYGEEEIISQRPYEAYFEDNYWIINGTLPEGYVGGTFLIILDSRNGKVLRITHGK